MVPRLPFVSGTEQPGPLRSAGITPLPRYYEPLRLLTRPGPDFGSSPYTGRSRPRARARRRARSPELRSSAVPTCHPDDPAGADRSPRLFTAPARGSLRPMHKGSAFSGLFISRLILGSLALRPAGSHDPIRAACPDVLERAGRPASPRRVLHAEQAIAWEAPFIPQVVEHLFSACAHLDILSKSSVSHL
jgi:hypothetical protein